MTGCPGSADMSRLTSRQYQRLFLPHAGASCLLYCDHDHPVLAHHGFHGHGGEHAHQNGYRYECPNHGDEFPAQIVRRKELLLRSAAL